VREFKKDVLEEWKGLRGKYRAPFLKLNRREKG
jgi:hypothetical protein